MPGSSWALINLVKTLNSKFETDWGRIPHEHRQAWGRLVLIGILSVLGALFLMIAGLRTIGRGANQFVWEEAALLLIEAGPVGFASAVWLQTFGSDFMLYFVVLTAVGMAIWKDRPLLAVSFLLALGVMDAVVRIGWFVFERVRPDLIAQGIASPGFHSFPSGHTSKTVAVYGLLAAQWFRASQNVVERIIIVALMILVALMVPYGRLRMGVHWPTDIMGGWVLGGLWLLFLVLALRHERTDSGAL